MNLLILKRMEEKNKYYIPSIEEFHVGFECETTGTLPESSTRWRKAIIQKESMDLVMSWHPKYGPQFRVKYLDKEDIEKLGFKGNEHYLRKNDIEIIAFATIDHKICIFDHDKCHPIFIGIIKNISELKTLLKQLKIT